ncbi:MAG: hypothetical protein P8182_15275 [Deltaproteobacteria bacterium]
MSGDDRQELAGELRWPQMSGTYCREALWKTPPKAKIYEALTAVGDNRVKLQAEHQAEVSSSDRTKTYIVEWTPDRRSITSNDNASYWQGYMGYPIVAVLMLLGSVDFHKEVADLLSGIPWKSLNKRFRNKYDNAIESVLAELDAKGVDRDRISTEVESIVEQIERLNMGKMPRRRRPPREHRPEK